MSNSFFMSIFSSKNSIFSKLIILIVIITFFICLLFIPFFNKSLSMAETPTDADSFIISNDEFVWPIPGYTSVTSPFGKRYSPTAGASSYHKGMDIGAPKGTSLYAVCDGEITFAGFLGGGGYTITLTSGLTKFTYCHVSPTYIVHIGDLIKKGQLIGFVGPKNVYGVPGNTYKDSQGNPTNGATTGPHLHFGVRKNDKYINPLSLFE